MRIDNKTFDEIHIGDSARLQRTLTKEDIDVFGVLSGDMNPTHFSDEYARILLDRHKVIDHSMWGGALISRRNAIQLAMALDIRQPKVAILSAVETVNPKIPATLDAVALCKMADRGQIEGALIDGPLAARKPQDRLRQQGEKQCACV
jgi:acyl dehydratase